MPQCRIEFILCSSCIGRSSTLQMAMLPAADFNNDAHWNSISSFCFRFQLFKQMIDLRYSDIQSSPMSCVCDRFLFLAEKWMISFNLSIRLVQALEKCVDRIFFSMNNRVTDFSLRFSSLFRVSNINVHISVHFLPDRIKTMTHENLCSTVDDDFLICNH